MQLFLQTCTPSLAESKAYFKNLDFELLSEDDFTLVYDQQLNILIDHTRFGRKGVTLVKENWERECQKLSEHVHLVQNKEEIIFVGPSGTRFNLKSRPALDLPKSDRSCILGNYAGISIETMHIEKSIAILSILGFSQNSGSIEQGWVTCTDKYENTISLMNPFSCPHLFINPSGTFFNSGKNLETIANIRKRNIDVYEEITAFNPAGEVDNIVLREPGGLGFFVFND